MKARTKEENAAYQRDYRRRMREKRQEPKGLSDEVSRGADKTPETDTQDMSTPLSTVSTPAAPWKSIDSIIRPAVPDPHVQCDRTIALLEEKVQRARDRYDPMLGVLMNIYAACARQGEVRQYLLYEDIIAKVRAVVDGETDF
jgi:hypothetical protein